MTDQDLERRLRAWYRADGDADSAPTELRADLAAIGQEAESRRLPTGWRFPRMSRSAPMALAATALVVAILVGLAFFLAQPPNVGPTGSPSPSGTASTEPNATPNPDLPLGGGLILTYQPHIPAGACSNIADSPFDVYTVDAGTGERTLLGTAGTFNGCRPRGLAFQWAPDRIHVLMTDEYGQNTLTLDPMTAAGQQLSFIGFDLPTDVWEGGSQTGQGWVLSPGGDRMAAVHTSSIQYPGQEGTTGIADGIVVINIDGSGEQTLMLPAGADMWGGGVSWSPDQSAIVVTACLPCNHADRGQPPTAVNQFHLFVVPVDGSPVRDVRAVTSGSIWGAAWSADASEFAAIRSECQAGETLPFCSLSRITSRLELVDATDGSEQVLVTGEQVRDAFTEMTAPMWSRDGTRIAFSAWSETNGANAFVVEADGSNLTPLGGGGPLGWSPDGEWLLVARSGQDETTSELWIVRPDGTGAQQIGSSPDEWRAAAW
jgi:Tol biopolymer transport system component